MDAPQRKLAQRGHHWAFTVSSPPRELFAVMEQMLGTPPYRFQVLGPDEAQVLEVSRLGLVGQWSKRIRRPAWVRMRAVRGERGTTVEVSASVLPFAPLRGLRLTPVPRVPGADRRALQLVQLLTRGELDARTVYRDRRIPSGPVTLVASWAGTPYRLYAEPTFESTRGEAILTATRMVAIAQQGSFVRIQLPEGTTGWVELDQIVAAPEEATRGANARVAGVAG